MSQLSSCHHAAALKLFDHLTIFINFYPNTSSHASNYIYLTELPANDLAFCKCLSEMETRVAFLNANLIVFPQLSSFK